MTRRRPRYGPAQLAIQRFADSFGLGATFAILLFYFPLQLLLARTTATGGDTGAHVYASWLMRSEFLPSGRVSGWSQGWFAGFPAFHFYFPLVAVFQALLSYAVPFEIAFKLGTVLGTFFLPIAFYVLFRLLRFDFPAPIVAAFLSLGFLLMHSFTIYGGNIPSSLAGEYSFSLSLGLCLVFMGLLYRLMTEHRARPWLASLVLALAVLSHLIPVMVVLLLVPLLGMWGVRRLGVRRAAQRLGTILALTFALTAFWSVPFLARLGYAANMRWIPTSGIQRLIPGELWIFLVPAALGVVLAVVARDWRVLLLGGPGIVGAVVYLLLPQGHVWNGRFIPFWYVTVFLVAAYGIGASARLVAGALIGVLRRSRPTLGARATSVVAAFLGGTLLLGVGAAHADKQKTFVDDWIRWNYTGYEAKPSYPRFRSLIDALGDLPPGRVMWEPSSELGRLGTPIALMTLPYFTGDPSMEGLYYESSITTVFHFLMASEVAERPSNPIPDLPYHPFDLDQGVRHMELFGVTYFIAWSDLAREGASLSPVLQHVADAGGFSIFRLRSSGPVLVPSYEPVVLTGEPWTEGNMSWFSDPADLDVPLVADGPPEWRRIHGLASGVPRTPVPGGGALVDAEVTDDTIRFTTDAVGRPHWIKTSFFPNWTVEGGTGPYLASPSLMLVVPTATHVVLRYERTWAEWLGLGLTGLAAAAAAIGPLRRRLRAWGGG